MARPAAERELASDRRLAAGERLTIWKLIITPAARCRAVPILSIQKISLVNVAAAGEDHGPGREGAGPWR